MKKEPNNLLKGELTTLQIETLIGNHTDRQKTDPFIKTSVFEGGRSLEGHYEYRVSFDEKKRILVQVFLDGKVVATRNKIGKILEKKDLDIPMSVFAAMKSITDKFNEFCYLTGASYRSSEKKKEEVHSKIDDLYGERPFHVLPDSEIESFVLGHFKRSENKRQRGTRYLAVNPKEQTEGQTFGYLIRDRQNDSSIVTAGFWGEKDIAASPKPLSDLMYRRLQKDSKRMLRDQLSVVQSNVNRINLFIRKKQFRK